jgi:Protein of unknown function (DUF2934)
MNQPSEITDPVSGPSHEQMATLAYSIWVSEEYPEGREEANWQEAKRQLAVERPNDHIIEVTSGGPPAN